MDVVQQSTKQRYEWYLHAWEILILNTEGYTVAAVALSSWLAEGRNFGEFKDKDVQKDRTDDVSR